MKSKKISAVLVFAVFIGIVAGLIIASNFNLTNKGIAAFEPDVKPVLLGNDDPIPSELLGLDQMSKGFAKVAERVSPSIVTINSEQVVKQQANPFFQDEFFKRFFNMPDQDEERTMRGLGSGVIINPDGYILTNNHVVKDADEITVSMDGKEYDAKVIGTDPESDLAVIKIEKEGLTAIKLGDSENLKVGEWVLALGNPFSEMLETTVTAGIVSAKGRKLNDLGGGSIHYQDFIQTDAAINPGNSGGALVNLHGELVGINTAILGQANVGIGFAIPINLARSVMEQLIADGHVVRGYLGVQIAPVTEEMAEFYKLDTTDGAHVQQVMADGPADKAGVKVEDVIIELDGKKITSPDHLTNTVASIPPNTKVEVKVWRDGKVKELKVELAERPDGGIAKAETDQVEEKVESKIGIEVANLTADLARQYGYDEVEGIIITNVKSNSVAAKEGIRRGHLITAANRKPVRNVKEFNDIVKDMEEGNILLLRLKAGDSSFFRALRIPKDKE